MKQVYNFEKGAVKIWKKERTASLIEGTIKPAVNFEVVLCLKTIFRYIYAIDMPPVYVDYLVKK